MKSGKFLTLIIIFLILTGLFFIPSALAAIGTPHIIYGKVFNSDGIVPGESNLEIYAYIPARPDELLSLSSLGCGYSNSDGMWFETGNCPTPWSINENLRIIVSNTLLQESGVINLVLNSSGNQLFPDLYLESGDNVGPIASNALVDGTSPASIPEGTPNITLTAALDESLSGNNYIQRAEYFVDTDPGIGLGTEMEPSDGLFDASYEEVNVILDSSSWTENSAYTIYVRGQDSAGNWGSTHLVVVSVLTRNIIPANIDVNPKTLNTKSKGKFITAYIELMTPYNVSDIDIATIALKDREVIIDSAFLSPTEIDDYDSDGISDLMVKFDRKTTIDYLISAGKITTSVEFIIEGVLETGEGFKGTSKVEVITP